MSDHTKLKNKPQKFLFDTNNFSEPDKDAEEEIIVPTFSEEELESAKRSSFEQGRAQGLKEAEESRGKFVSALLENVTVDLKSLFASEEERDKRYEYEAINLTMQIVKQLFPALNKKHGLDEIQAMLAEILDAQKEQPQIVIEVHPDYTQDIETQIHEIITSFHSTAIIDVTGKDDLGLADCRCSWKNGGARRNADALFKQIVTTLQEGLADQPIIEDNEVNDTEGVLSENNDAALPQDVAAQDEPAPKEAQSAQNKPLDNGPVQADTNKDNVDHDNADEDNGDIV